MNDWQSNLGTVAGGAATPTSLLFVGVSLNFARLLAYPWLTDRALVALVLLLAISLVAHLPLVPEPSIVLRGAAVLGVKCRRLRDDDVAQRAGVDAGAGGLPHAPARNPVDDAARHGARRSSPACPPGACSWLFVYAPPGLVRATCYEDPPPSHRAAGRLLRPPKPVAAQYQREHERLAPAVPAEERRPEAVLSG